MHFKDSLPEIYLGKKMDFFACKSKCPSKQQPCGPWALLQKQRLADQIQINTYCCTFRKRLNCFAIQSQQLPPIIESTAEGGGVIH